jgi:hypothetical protein
MKRKFDNLYLGLSAGLLTPLIAFYIYYLYDFRFMSMKVFFGYLQTNSLFTSDLKRCVIANLASFFLFIYTERMKSARGVLLSTFIYAAVIAYLTFLS